MMTSQRGNYRVCVRARIIVWHHHVEIELATLTVGIFFG